MGKMNIPLFNLDLCSHFMEDLVISYVYTQYIPLDNSF